MVELLFRRGCYVADSDPFRGLFELVGVTKHGYEGFLSMARTEGSWSVAVVEVNRKASRGEFDEEFHDTRP